MTHEAIQVQDDIRFVRQAVARRDGLSRGPLSIYLLWAVYVLVGYTMLDFAPKAAGWWLAFAGIGSGVLTGILARRHATKQGESDCRADRRSGLHFAGGILLSVLATFALVSVVPALQGPVAGQVCVMMIGLVYFTAGVHYEKRFLVLGLILMAGSIVVGLMDRYAWTTLGAIVAAGLVVPSLIPARPANADGTR